MFRPNTGIDLNDFPALGSPASSTRTPNASGSLPPQPPSSSLLPTNRFATYPSTASSSTHLQDTLLGTGSAVTAAGNSNIAAATANDFVVSGSSPLGSYQPVHSASAAAAAYAGHGSDHHVLANTRGLAPRTFSMDEFPALKSSTTAPGAATPFGNDLSVASKSAVGGEPWDYTAARESMSSK